MSTKTLRKRIALVAVAALGFGALSSVTVANAADHTPYVSSITVTTDKAPVAGANGTAVEHTVRFSTSTTIQAPVEPNVILTSKPAGSAMAIKVIAGAVTMQTALTAGQFQLSSVATVASAVQAQGVDINSAVEAGYTNRQVVTYLQAYYDLPGTYTYTIFDDSINDGVVSGSDFATLLKQQGIHVTTAQRLLGHSDSRITLNIYTQVLDEEIDSAGILLRSKI
jgi:hypothetical protein